MNRWGNVIAWMGGMALLLAFLSGPGGCGGTPRWEEIPPLGLSQKGVAEIDLDAYLRGGGSGVALAATGDSPGTVAAAIDERTHVATLTAAATFAGEVTITFTAEGTGGATASTDLRVKVHPNVSCLAEFRYDARGENVTQISVAGEFNGWSPTADPMRDDDGDGVYTAAIELPAGYHQYKFVVNGSDWRLDPENPYRAWSGGFLNSEWAMPDCNRPRLLLRSLSVDPAGRVEVVVHYQDGADGKGPDEESLTVTEGGRPLRDPGWDPFERVFDLRLGSLSEGKHTLRFSARSLSGRSALDRYVPVWIERTPFDWRDAILYNVFTDRFLDGDPGNDDRLEGVPFPSNNQGGDFAGVTRKIREGYFDDLGVNAIWLSPVIENIDHAEYGDDGRLYAPYHGYWPSAPREVESRFGGEEALRDLIEAAHDRGIRILFDLTANHVHSEHVYNRLHPDWINPFDWCGDGDSWNTNPIGCWFMDYLPDLDYRHPDALHTLVEDALFWIKTFDIDGFRIDAVKHMEPVFEEHLRARIREEIETDQVQFYLVGETFVGDWDWSGTSNQTVIREHVSEDRLTGQFDFPLYWDIVRTFARDERNIPDLEAVLSQTEDYYGAQAIMSNFLGNQDVPRFISHAAGDIADVWGNGAKEQGWTDPPQAPTWHEPYQRLELAFTFLMTIQGVPLIYYGDEIGLPGAGDPDNRRMMNWEDPGAFAGEVLAHLQALGQIRRAHKALSRGSRIPLLTSDEDVWVYARTMLTDKLVVALNRSGVERTVTVDLSGTGIPDGRTLTDELSGKRITVTGNRVTITLAPWQGAIFAL